MSKQILRPQKNYKNIYLFSSLENYGKKRKNSLKTIHFDDNDCIVVFNSPNLYVQKLLKDKSTLCDILKHGAQKAKEVASETISEVKKVTGLI